jgi:hypothetical protein
MLEPRIGCEKFHEGQKIMRFVLPKKSPEWHLRLLGVADAVLGFVVLSLALAFYGVYLWAARQGVIDPDFARDVKFLAAALCFGILAPLGLAFISTSYEIRWFLRKQRVAAQSSEENA